MIILYSKSMRLFMGSEFLVSHCGLHKPRHFYGHSSLGTMSDHNCRVFHPRGDLSLHADTRHIFSLSFQLTVRLCWMLSHLLSPPNQHQTQCRLSNHALTPNSMRCPLHVISCYKYNEHYMEQFINRTLC